MTGLEELVQAAMAAPDHRRAEALRILRGQAVAVDPRDGPPEPYLSLRETARHLSVSACTLWRWRIRANPHADAYEIHARATMGYAEAEPLKAYCDRTGSNLRQLAKARVLGLGFGCGWQKFIEVARVMAGLELDMEESKRIVADFRRSNPLIVNLWYRLEDACGAKAGGHFALPLPCTH